MAEARVRRPWRIPTGQFIRKYLLEHGDGRLLPFHPGLEAAERHIG